VASSSWNYFAENTCRGGTTDLHSSAFVTLTSKTKGIWMQTLKGKWIGSRSLNAGPGFTLGALAARWRNRFI
jgi:hypothetical protein